MNKNPQPKSNHAVTGLYFYDQQVVDLAKNLKSSPRGKLEITDLNRRTWNEARSMSKSWVAATPGWTSAPTNRCARPAQFIATLENRRGLKVACPEEIACRQQWIDAVQPEKQTLALNKNGYGQGYGQYLMRILKEKLS